MRLRRTSPRQPLHMIEHELATRFWKGFTVSEVKETGPKALLLELTPTHPPFCRGCGQGCLHVHDRSFREVRDCDPLDHQLMLKVPLRRVRCPQCGVRTEAVDWLSGDHRMTDRMVRWIEDLCRILPIQHVATHVDVSWHTAKRIDKARLVRELPAIHWEQVRHLVIDEFALHKGHRYATVVADADTRQVLWVGEGRSREAIRPFFSILGEHAHHIQAVAMDQNTAFDLEVKAHCPQAEVVYDLFHVVAKFGREVIDRVRVDQANALRDNLPARRAVKRSRWLLLKNRDKLNEPQEIALKELMQANLPLATVYVLKEQLKELWRCPTVWQAYRLWRSWFRACKESGLKPLISFARKLRPYLRGILASALYPLNTSVLEGMNNKIKVIKRMAYGYRDTEYFFLKIKHAFPGV